MGSVNDDDEEVNDSYIPLFSILNTVEKLPDREPVQRTKYQAIWQSIDETSSDLYRPIMFHTLMDAELFERACRSRRNTQRRYDDLQFQRINNIIYVKGRM